jgi:CDP-6-deoxy-D-xylo-4-hexulose-3-dehydrase
MNAAFGLVQLKRLDEIKEKRRVLFERYLTNLKDIPELRLPNNKYNTSWLAFPLMIDNRMELLTYLEDNNIQTRVCFAGNITRHPAYRQFFTPFTNSDLIMKSGFLIGAHHGMTIDDVDYICDKIKAFIGI